MINFVIILLMLLCAFLAPPDLPVDVNLAIGVGTALLVGSLVGGAASIFGSSSANRANADSQSSANQANLQIARENNAFNRQERLETQQFNRDMWYEQQNYNSPIAQAARLRAGGFNPSLVMDDAGNSTSPVTSSPVSAAPVAPIQAAHYDNIFASAPAYMQNAASAMLQAEQAKGIGIDNQTKLQQNMAAIDNMIADTESKLAKKHLDDRQRINLEDMLHTQKVQRDYLEFQYDREFRHSQFDDETWRKQLRALDDEHEFKTAQTDSLKIANAIQNKYGMRITQLQIAKMSVEIREAQARIGLLSQQTHLTSAQVTHEYQKASETIARTLGIKQNNKHFKAICGDIEAEMHLRGFNANVDYRVQKDPFVRSIYGINRNLGFGSFKFGNF